MSDVTRILNALEAGNQQAADELLHILPADLVNRDMAEARADT